LVVAVVICLVLLVTASGPAYSNAPPAAHDGMRQGMWRAIIFYVAFGGALSIAAATGVRASRGAAET
jgi:hypothetical protein